MDKNATVFAPLRQAEQCPGSNPRCPVAHLENVPPANLPASSPYLAHVLVPRQLPAVGWREESENGGRPPLARNLWGLDFEVGPVGADRLVGGLSFPVMIHARPLPE